MQQISIMLFVTGWLWISISATASASDRISPPQTLVSLEFVDDQGSVFASYPTGPGRSSVLRAYLEARLEARYNIRARNLSGERVGIVIAVDGRNIVSGERSELGRSESMYVLEPYQSATYTGWRTSETEVRRFFFTDVENSYASRIGDESATGVIAAAVYKARRAPTGTRRRQPGDRASAPSPSAEADDRSGAGAERSAQAGTGFGENQRSRAIRVAFSPARRASERSFFKYEWSEQLCARGVKMCERPNRFWPEPWHGFVPFPPDQRG